METLGIITARGGSKSIPKKNIALCAGKPLMYYIIKAAQNAKSITRLIISTDDEEIASYARSEGVEVPFMRPPELSQDDSPDIATFQHALKELAAKGYVPDIMVHLRPTAPLARSSDIDKGVQLLAAHPEADSVRSVSVPPYTPFKMYTIDAKGFLQPLLKKEFPEVYEKFDEPFNAERQLLPAVWRHAGAVDVVRASVVAEGRMNGTNILPLVVEGSREIDIDSPADLVAAGNVIEALRAQGKEAWE